MHCTTIRICITYEYAASYADSVWRTDNQFFVYNIDSFLGIVIGCIVAFSLISSTVWNLPPFNGESHRSQWVKSELWVMVGELKDLGVAVFCPSTTTKKKNTLRDFTDLHVRSLWKRLSSSTQDHSLTSHWRHVRMTANACAISSSVIGRHAQPFLESRKIVGYFPDKLHVPIKL